MWRRCIAVLAVVAAASLAPGARAQIGVSGPCLAASAPPTTTVTITSGGRQRTAVVHTPAAAAGQPLPVLIALHGAAQDGTFFANYTGFSTLADAQKFIAVYPNALPSSRFDNRPFWNVDSAVPGQPDDVTFISDLLDAVEAAHCVDATRIFATGVSNGGGMAARLGCDLSDRITAIAPVAGGYKSLPPCHPAQRVSVLEVHGTYDGTVPYNGDKGTGAGAVMPYVEAWAKIDGCPSAPNHTTPAPRVVRLLYTHCAARTAVAHLRIAGGGHQLPGGLPSDPGQASSIDIPWEIWRFFRAHGERLTT
jgi:polyhydroxybutyrate depolymerase